jgi:ubiquinone/menaquinone biosynthesis C-methylase UbiE
MFLSLIIYYLAKTMQRPHYGIDAPGLLRFFFIAGIGALAILVGVLFTSFWQPLRIVFGLFFSLAATYLLGMGCFMIYFSSVEKLKERDKLLDLVEWSGGEIVLDVGCGRGLMLVGAAKRLSSGKAIGIDLWQEQDQADNHPEATQKNAKIEGVSDRIEVKTADIRALPFPNNYFDVIISNWTIHNLEAESDRHKALDEIIRVLKPNGRVVLADIVNQSKYAEYFNQHGMTKVQLHNNPIRDAVLKAVFFGSFAPSAVSACKDGLSMA